MIALLIAAAAAFAPNNLPISPNSACRQHTVQAATGDPASLLRPQDRTAAKSTRLGDLPKANLEIAVARSVGGCPAPVIVRYEVEGDGRFAAGAGSQ